MAEGDVYAHAAVLHPAATMDLEGSDRSDRSDRGLPTAAQTSDHPTGPDQPVTVPPALTTSRLAPGAQSVASRASVPALPAGLADAVEHALAASAQRTQLLQYAGQSYIIKRTASRPRNLVQSMVLRWLAKRLTGQALPLRTLRLSQGVCGMGGEAIRLAALAKAGVRVPRIVDQGAGHLLLEHCGTSVAALLLNWDASVWRCELPRLARDLAAFHRAGHWHGAAQIKNLTRREGLDFRIDFEEDFGGWLPLAAAQALDLALFLNSISLRGPIDEIESRGTVACAARRVSRRQPRPAVDGHAAASAGLGIGAGTSGNDVPAPSSVGPAAQRRRSAAGTDRRDRRPLGHRFAEVAVRAASPVDRCPQPPSCFSP